ncbi:15109_t:CDS:2 [Cetraspora pellucida]|uniref:15109_t:CDS:1 n=1 Tax=Cetraspora pellucida TaxID=1433469 RepID=A0A9N9GUL2_9GLOM|nr:15109_t:CDS:2 [Cetraspora pellucida]
MKKGIKKILSPKSRFLDAAIKDDSIAIFEFTSFKNIKEVGKGRFGVVHSADYNEKKVALKCFFHSEITKEFVNELKQLRLSNSHPNVNQFHGITIDPKTENLMLVLQFANGGNLEDYLKTKWNDGTFKISLSEIIKIAKQIILGLEHLHTKNIIHEDAKVEFITNRERQPKPILADDLTDVYSRDLLTVEPSTLIIKGPTNSRNLKVSSPKSILSRHHEKLEPNDLKFQGLVYYEAKNYEASLEFLNKSLDVNSDDADALKFRGLTYYKLKKYEKSISDFNKSLHITNDIIVLICRGQINSNLGRYNEALIDLNKALKLDPNNSFALRCRGQTYYMQKKYKESLIDLNKSLEYDLNNADALRLRGQTYYMLKDYEKALSDLNKSLELDPNNAVTLRFRGRTYLIFGRYDDSLTDLNKSLDIDSKNADALQIRGQINLIKRSPNKQLKDLNKELNFDPKSIEGLQFRTSELRKIEKTYKLNRYEIWFDAAISGHHIRVFKYDEFNNLEKIDEGGYGTVFKADWKNHELPVVLKSLKANNIPIVKELQLLLKVSFHPNINQLYGVTKDLEPVFHMLKPIKAIFDI